MTRNDEDQARLITASGCCVRFDPRSPARAGGPAARTRSRLDEGYVTVSSVYIPAA